MGQNWPRAPSHIAFVVVVVSRRLKSFRAASFVSFSTTISSWNRPLITMPLCLPKQSPSFTPMIHVTPISPAHHKRVQFLIFHSPPSYCTLTCRTALFIVDCKSYDDQTPTTTPNLATTPNRETTLSLLLFLLMHT